MSVEAPAFVPDPPIEVHETILYPDLTDGEVWTPAPPIPSAPTDNERGETTDED